MFAKLTRRRFLHTAAAGGALLGLNPLLASGPATTREATVTPELVRFGPGIEPVIRLIQQTPREKCFEVMADQLRQGLPYRQFMAALFLAGLRNFNPRRAGAMHGVYVIHSAHQLSLDARPEERLLPLFYALDYFKRATAKPRDWDDPPLRPLRGELPPAEKALEEFHAGMRGWDAERSDRAIVALVRSRGVQEVGEALWPYGGRDVRRNGHKAIFLSNAWRTLETIGWQHAEPVLRAVVLGLVASGNNAEFKTQPYLPNLERVRKVAPRLPGDWALARSDAGPTRELLAVLREGRTDDACQLAAAQLVEGRGRAGSVWDAVHLAAAELIMRERNAASNLGGVHAVTSANALHYAFRMSGPSQTRLLVLLQAVGWMGEFRKKVGVFRDVRIAELAPGDVPSSPASEEAAAREVLGALAPDRKDSVEAAVPKVVRYAQRYPESEAFFREARRLICLNSSDEHHYKYSAAVFEHHRLVDPRWRPHMLAAALHYFPSVPNSNMQRAREALGAK